MNVEASITIVHVHRVTVTQMLNALKVRHRPTREQRMALKALRKGYGIAREDVAAASDYRFTARTLGEYETDPAWIKKCSIPQWTYRQWIVALQACINDHREKVRLMAWKRGIL